MRRRSNRLDALILEETNSAASIGLTVGVGCAEDEKNLHAWSLDSRQQVRDERTGKTFQVISERSYKPLVIYRGDGESSKVAAQNLTVISSQTEDEEMVFLETRKNKDGRLLWIGICLAFLTLILCIVVFVRINGA